MSKFEKKFKTPKQKIDEPKGPLPACPTKDKIYVTQFQYFDNGEPKKADVVERSEDGTIKREGAGKSRSTIQLEVYCEAKFNIYKPYWKRTVALLDPERVKKWANKQLAEGRRTQEEHDFYLTLYSMAGAFMELHEDAHWAKIGYIEDRRSKVRYPGQAVLATKIQNGPMDVYMFVDGNPTDPICPDAMIYDKLSHPGSKRRLFYGFFDPINMYGKQKEIEAKERAYLSGRSTPSVPTHSINQDEFRDFRSPF